MEPAGSAPPLRGNCKKILSIFTLRPTVRSHAPPTAPAPSDALRRRRRWSAALCGLAAGLLLSLGVGQRPSSAGERMAPVVLVHGAPKLKTTPSGDLKRWNRADVTVTLDASLEQLGPGARDAVVLGFGTWIESQQRLPALRFDHGAGATPSLEPDGKNTVMFAAIDIPGHKNDLAITIGFANPSTGHIVETDIIINARRHFALLEGTQPAAHPPAACQSRYDLQNVITHEVGHFFGLDEDDEDATTTMYFKISACETHKRDLTDVDRSVMTSLYEGADFGAGDERATNGCAVVPRGSIPIESDGMLVLAGMVAAAVSLRRAGAARWPRAPRP